MTKEMMDACMTYLSDFAQLNGETPGAFAIFAAGASWQRRRPVPGATSPRYLRPSVGTASMFSALYKMAVTDEWCRGWNSLLSAQEAAGCETDPNSPWPPLVPCPACNGSGEVCVGRDEDGNLMEPCETCDRYGRVAAPQVKPAPAPMTHTADCLWPRGHIECTCGGVKCNCGPDVCAYALHGEPGNGGTCRRASQEQATTPR